MPHYYLKEKPAPPWQSSSSNGVMNVTILLDQPAHGSFTNLDDISGRLLLRNPKELDVDNILVKLEGESRTRLLSPAGSGEKQKPQVEYHKILYKVAMVFPPPHVINNRHNYAGKNAQTLAPGAHEFPFTFKFPFNNSCVHEMTKSPSMKGSSSGTETAKAATHHVKKTLPPTLSGFPGEAEIRYYLKGTVTRHYFWKDSLRTIIPINFFPIEPPRPPPAGTEVYARQTHTFVQLPPGDSGKSRMKSIFGRPTESSIQNTTNGGPTIAVDARLPEPAILTCNEDIPLRILVKKMSDFNGIIHLQSLQVSLIGHTKIRAHEAYRSESTSWIIMTKSNMGMSLGAASDAVDAETAIPDRLWRGEKLPNTVAPSFQACNIDRTYQLEARVGLSYTDPSQSNIKPLSVVLPLRLDLEVYSGIAPPVELLAAMAEAHASIRRRSTVDSATEKLRRASTFSTSMSLEGSAGGQASSPPAQQGVRVPASLPPEYADAPPSYEDTVGGNLPAVNAPRPEYAPPSTGDADYFGGDEKRRFFGRREP